MTATSRGIRLDWSGRWAPHAVLDLLRSCNLACPGCYNEPGAFAAKTLGRIEEELRDLRRLRRLQTVSLTGGEPLLHPELDKIIRMVKAHGLRTVLMTNAVLLDAARAGQLKAAGLDMVLMHIQTRQGRPDLPVDGGVEAASALRAEKARLVAEAGLDAGFSALMYPDEASHAEISGLLAEVVASPSAHFAMICPQGDFSVFAELGGDLTGGYRQPRPRAGGFATAGSVLAEAETLYARLRAAGFGVFAWIGSSTDPEAQRWSAWNAGVLRGDAAPRTIPLEPAWTDRALLRLIRMIGRRQLFHLRGSAARFRLQLLLGLLDRGAAPGALRLLAGSCRPGVHLLRKHVVVELPPARHPDGSIIFCRECPDATLHQGRLVPPCLADRFSRGPTRHPFAPRQPEPASISVSPNQTQQPMTP